MNKLHNSILLACTVLAGVAPVVFADEQAENLPVLAYWKFDSSDPYADSSGNGNTIDRTDRPVVMNGGYAHFPHGTSGVFGRPLNLGSGDGLTVEFFVRSTSLYLASQCFLSYYNYNGEGTSFFALYGGGNKQTAEDMSVTWLKSPAGRETDAAAWGSLSDRIWHHVAVVFEKGADDSVTDEMRLYIDGVRHTDDGTTSAVHHSNWFGHQVTLVLGYWSHGGVPQNFTAQMQPFEGDIDDVRVTAKALTPAQFLQTPTVVESDEADVVEWIDTAAVPAAGTKVHVPKTARITLDAEGPTPRFASISIDGVVDFPSAASCLSADTVHVGAAGRLFAGDPCSGPDGTPNRLWIDCGDLTVDAGGLVSAVGCGFAGATVKSAEAETLGPGVYRTEQDYAAGAGAHGGYSTTGWQGKGAYGSAEWPVTAGSGGMTWHTDLYGSNGGGVIRIDATGSVTVNGRVTADAFDLIFYPGYGRACAGAGGSVLINCATVAGSGEISARGGNSSGNEFQPGNNGGKSGVGGGGRIAIHYNPDLQTAAMTENLVVAAQSGRSGTRGYGFAENGFRMLGGAGTIWLPDVKLITAATLTNFRGRLVNAPEIDLDGDVIVSDWVGLATDGAKLSVSGNLTVTGQDGRLELGSVDQTMDATVQRKSYSSATAGQLSVGGNLIVTAGARLDVYAAKTNAAQAVGAIVSVGEMLRIQKDAKVYPVSEPSNGGSALFVVKDFEVENGGTFGLAGGGFSGGAGGKVGKGPGYGSSNIGAGHGGLGGRVVESGSGQYGQLNDDVLRPSLPGSGGGHGWNGQPGGGCGGGCLQVVASNSVVIAGTVDADGTTPQNYNKGSTGGAGGTVRFDTLSFTLAETGVITAKGGGSASMTMQSGSYTAAGGGGRVAIWTGATLWEPGLRSGQWTVTDTLPDSCLGNISVDGGLSLAVNAEAGFAGEAGTIRFVTVSKKPGMSIIVR